MTLIIVHFHLRPGGVRRVIELGTPALVRHWPERLRRVVLATGEAPDASWLKGFQKRLAGTRVEVLVEPAFGYVAELRSAPKELERRVEAGVVELVAGGGREERVLWAHNLGLGRNLYLARALAQYSAVSGCPLVAHHHDWWFDNRWHLFTNLKAPGFRKLDAVARAIFHPRQGILHAAINQADAGVLRKHFPRQTGWLPNPVEPPAEPPVARVQFARRWLEEALGSPREIAGPHPHTPDRGLISRGEPREIAGPHPHTPDRGLISRGEAAPVWLVPCRLLRRKNLAEALLLTRWLRPEAWLVTTGGVSSAEEAAYAATLTQAATAHGWRLRLGLLAENEDAAPSVRELLAASEAVLLTSLVEGFGLPYLEAAAGQRPLLARRLPNIAPDLAKFGFKFPQSYAEVRIAPGMFDWAAERARQRAGFDAWRALLPRSVQGLAGRPELLTAASPGPVPFSRLTLAAQLEVLARPVAASWAACAPLNPWLELWRQRAARGGLQASPWPRSALRWLGGAAYARRFLELLARQSQPAPAGRASTAVQSEFLRRKLRGENLYPLLWEVES